MREIKHSNASTVKGQRFSLIRKTLMLENTKLNIHEKLNCSSMGVFCNFATSTTNFRQLYPGIRSKVATLSYHFYIPFYRELLLSWGIVSADSESLANLLTQSNNNLAVCNYDGYTSNAVSTF